MGLLTAGAQDGLPTGLLAPKTASARASCRLHDNFLDEASVMTSVLIRRLCFPVDFGIRDNCLDDFLDETSVKRTVLQLHFTACQLTSVALCDGFTLVSHVLLISCVFFSICMVPFLAFFRLPCACAGAGANLEKTGFRDEGVSIFALLFSRARAKTRKTTFKIVAAGAR